MNTAIPPRVEIFESCVHLLTLLIPAAFGLVLSGAATTDNVVVTALGLIAAWVGLRFLPVRGGRHRRDTGW